MVGVSVEVGSGLVIAIGVGVEEGVGADVGEGVGDGMDMAGGVGEGVADDVGIGVGIAVGVGACVGVGVCVRTAKGVGVAVCAATKTLILNVSLKPEGSDAIIPKVAVPSTRGVIDRSPSSSPTEAASDSSTSAKVYVSGSPSMSVKNWFRFRLTGASTAVSSCRGIS